MKERGLLLAHSLSYVVSKRPKLVVYENVPGLLRKRHQALMAWLLLTLEEAEYRWWYTVLNTNSFAIPHNRRRLYIVGIQTRHLRRAFTWPTPLPRAPAIDEFLEPNVTGKPRRSLTVFFNWEDSLMCYSIPSHSHSAIS